MIEGDTPLIDAARHGRLADVAGLLSGGADVNEPKTDGSGATALLVAANHGHAEVVSALLGSGATVDSPWDGVTPLWTASENGHAEIVSALLAAGAEVDPIMQEPGNEAAATPLFVACGEGHVDVVSALLNAGASIDWSDRDNQATPLMAASQQGHVEVLTVLLEAGAAVNQTDVDTRTAMTIGCAFGRLTCVKLLCSYGAARTFSTPHGEVTAEEVVGVATATDNEAITAFLVESRRWSTPLHHLRIIGATRAREQLRGGADLHAAAAAGGPTPLSLAQALRAAGDAAEGSAASLVLAAAEPWGPRTHSLFPAAARTFAAELLLIGHQLSRQPRFSGEEISLVDVWTQLVMPFATAR